MLTVQAAKGASIRKEDLIKQTEYVITAYGASEQATAIENTQAINRAIVDAYENGGGTVVIPIGDYHTYTIVLKSNVNLRLDSGAILRAARTDIQNSYEKQIGEGGNYLEPEINLYAGLQDHGHSYFANSLIYAEHVKNIMIYGDGLIDGSYIDEITGFHRYALMGGDPYDQPYRNKNGHIGEWFGNKGIALVHCKNVVLADFSFVIGGHFAVIAEDVTNLYVEHLLIDTTRDAFDIDCCQDVTVVHSVFNSLTDDALVIKASYGAGVFMPSRNILIEDCTVSGYDAGSVYAGVYSCDKLIATDSCGPTGRVKLGTESTCGYEKVTVRRVNFKRSRGFALEAVDGSDLKDIIFEDCCMDQVSSSPIFIRVGDRGRFPVTGNSEKALLIAEEPNIRLDNLNWVLPDTDEYQKWPIQRFTPSYRKDYTVSIDGNSKFQIVNPLQPTKANKTNLVNKNISEEREQYYYANACGCKNMATVDNILIRNVTITNADPRYPILIMGLTDSSIANVLFENVSVTYRGGLTMEHATEQRQLFTNWEYTQYKTASSVQTLPWLVNPFFLKEEGLLPRADWNASEKKWIDDPYNVPELPNVYPEPSNWGILPAYGIYIRHAKNITFHQVSMHTLVPDKRHAIVLDDVQNITLSQVNADDANDNLSRLALVEHHYRRPTNREYVMEEPYFTTTVTDLSINNVLDGDISVEDIVSVQVKAPAPGTPSDTLYPYPTIPIPETGYSYKVATQDYPLPQTVYRPFIASIAPQLVQHGELIKLPIILRNPSSQISQKAPENFIYTEQKKEKTFTVDGIQDTCIVTLKTGYNGTSYDMKESLFIWDTSKVTPGLYDVIFSIDDQVLIDEFHVTIEIKNTIK